MRFKCKPTPTARDPEATQDPIHLPLIIELGQQVPAHLNPVGDGPQAHPVVDVLSQLLLNRSGIVRLQAPRVQYHDVNVVSASRPA